MYTNAGTVGDRRPVETAASVTNFANHSSSATVIERLLPSALQSRSSSAERPRLRH